MEPLDRRSRLVRLGEPRGIPNEPNLAPPGWYMLFLTNRTGIPSVASWVRLNAADALATVADSIG
jgi:Domain of unknown function (DUF1929)